MADAPSEGSKGQPLYHYTDAAGLYGIVSDMGIWATHIRFLNDAREVAHTVDLFADRIRKRLEEDGLSEAARQLLLMLAPFPYARAKAHRYVVCFSEEGDQLSQWHAYGNRATGGFAIGFDRRQLLRLAKDQAFQLVMCEYEKANQSAAVDGVLDRVLAAANGQNPPVFEDVLEWFLADFTDLAVGFKDGAFRDEREVRLGSEEGGAHFEAEKTREGPLMPIPYVEFDISFTWPITEIVVGPTPHPEAAMEAVWHLFMSVRKVPPQIRKSEIPIRSLR